MTDREVVEKWRAYLLYCRALDHRATMTALLEDGPQYEAESKASKAVEELESLPTPGYDVSLDRLTDQRITEEPSEIIDEAPDSADDGPEVDIIRKARR